MTDDAAGEPPRDHALKLARRGSLHLIPAPGVAARPARQPMFRGAAAARAGDSDAATEGGGQPGAGERWVWVPDEEYSFLPARVLEAGSGGSGGGGGGGSAGVGGGSGASVVQVEVLHVSGSRSRCAVPAAALGPQLRDLAVLNETLEDMVRCWNRRGWRRSGL